MKLHELHESIGRTAADLDFDYDGDSDFDCYEQRLTSLRGSPNFVAGSFVCRNNYLTSLKGGPEEVVYNYDCSKNKLTSLEGAPKIIGGYFYCAFNSLTSLEGIHLKISRIDGYANFKKNPIKSHVLGLLLIDGLHKVWFDNENLDEIINKYLKGSRDVFECQNELMDAGLDEYAQL
jgi:hypothetical protein